MSTTTRESRRPELRLPEISREGIARGLSEIHVPDLSKMERPTIEMPDIDVSMSDFTRNVGKAVTSAAVAVGLVRPPRPRWPFLLGGAIIVGLAGWALMHSTAFREWLDRVTGIARVRIDEMREERDDMDAVAFTAAETMPIEPGPYAENGSADVAGALDAAGVSANDYPEGLGATTDMMNGAAEGIPAFEVADEAEESEARA
jgi:hypothetical protein